MKFYHLNNISYQIYFTVKMPFHELILIFIWPFHKKKSYDKNQNFVSALYSCASRMKISSPMYVQSIAQVKNSITITLF
jgi:hypothetical protein